MKKYTVYIIYAYEEKSESGDFLHSVEVQLIDKTPELALERAKLITKKPFVYLKTIIEKYHYEN